MIPTLQTPRVGSLTPDANLTMTPVASSATGALSLDARNGERLHFLITPTGNLTFNETSVANLPVGRTALITVVATGSNETLGLSGGTATNRCTATNLSSDLTAFASMASGSRIAIFIRRDAASMYIIGSAQFTVGS